MVDASDNGNVMAEIAPSAVRRIHLVGVAGTGMGAFAGMLKAAGYTVTGSDENVYPPMSDMLRAWDVEVYTPYSSDNLDRARPDLVIIGNVIRRVNAEATAVRARGLRQMSFPAAFASLIIQGKHSIVIAGTHGKTTTSALMAHVLVVAGLDPTFLVGGVTLDHGGNFRLGAGAYVVVEGDEYDTAYFDKGPKFLHYRARTALLTSIEFDHADIYRNLAHYESAYARFCGMLPADGWLGVSASYPRALEIARAAAAVRVVTYGVSADGGSSAPSVPEFAARDVHFNSKGASFRIDVRTGEDAAAPGMVPAGGSVLLPMSGRHNVENAVGVYAVARSLGIPHAAIEEAFATFRGVKRRQEVRGEPGGVLIIDDFAHHPTAVRETIAGIRERYADRRLWAVFEPRSNTSRRNIHQREYAAAFDRANVVVIRTPLPHDQVPADEQLDVRAVVDAIGEKGIPAFAFNGVEEIAALVTREARAGDVLLVMSNGAFGGLLERLLQSLGNAPR
jgi:UDP-N-acetylmuramate: L-alanyl-gamma-D-glutamyl-meso-diaminopimelate ligase